MANLNISSSVLHEQGFNYKLAEALSSVNARWYDNPRYIQTERAGAISGSSQRADLIIDDPSIPPLVIECAYGGDGDRDADEKLDTGAFHTAIALCIPETFKRLSEQAALDALIKGETVEYAIKQHGFRFPEQGYIRGTVKDLSSMIQAVAVSKEQVEEVANEVATYINQAAREVEEGLSEKDCSEIAEMVHQRSNLTGFRTVMILWLDSLLVQRQLRKQGVDVATLPLTDVNLEDLLESWRNILKSNWSSVYSPAVELLMRTAERAHFETRRAIDLLVKAVNVIEEARLGVQINVGAELFPKVSEDQKTASAFYTTPSTAEFLARLTIREVDRDDWSDPNVFVDQLRIVDLACGTGTLVRAAFNRVRALHDAFNATMETHKQMHSHAMERGLIACDVSPIAAHLTNSSMAVLGNGQPYANTNIGWVSVGKPVLDPPSSTAGTAPLTTGSLEFLKRDALTDLFDSISESASGVETDRDRNGESIGVQILDGSADYIIMNPPYVRTRGGRSAFDIAGLSESERRGCQLQWERLIRNEPCVKTAGLGASFVCLAARKIKPGGRIGFVLPNSAGFAQSWGRTRKMLLDEFENVIAISKAGKSEGSDAMSADTHLGEMLLVADRKGPASPARSDVIYCVSLNQVPIRQGISGEYAKSILDEIDNMSGSFSYVKIGVEDIATIEKFAAEGENPWSPLGVLNPELSAAANHLAAGILMDFANLGPDMAIPVPMRPMQELFEVGPTHHLIGHPRGTESIGAFTLDEITRESDARGGLRSLWKADSKNQTRLLVAPTHKGSVYDEQAAERVRSQRGHLHYQRGMQWTSQRLLTATTDFPVFGGRAWTTLRNDDRRVENAFALWANSTLGLLVHWTRGQRQQRGRSQTQVGAISVIPTPDFSKLPDPMLDLAAEKFKVLSQEPLQPASQANADAVRHAIDEAVFEILNMPKDRASTAVAVIRDWWCNEPTVTG